MNRNRGLFQGRSHRLNNMPQFDDFQEFPRSTFQNQRNNLNIDMYDYYQSPVDFNNRRSTFDDLYNVADDPMVGRLNNSLLLSRPMSNRTTSFESSYLRNSNNPTTFQITTAFQNNLNSRLPLKEDGPTMRNIRPQNRNTFNKPQLNASTPFKHRIAKKPTVKVSKSINKVKPLSSSNISAVKGTPKKTINSTDEAITLTPDKEPSVVVRGRMEYAIGQIIKEFKLRHNNDPVVKGCLEITFFERIVKDLIRERITRVMMNKKVENHESIVDAYQKEYPLEKDNEILEILTVQQIGCMEKNADKFLYRDTDDPKKFFRMNMYELVDKSVNELLNTVEKLYESREQEIVDAIDNLPDLDTCNSNLGVSESVMENVENDTHNTNSEQHVTVDGNCGDSGDGNENTDNDQQVMADDTCDGSGDGNKNTDNDQQVMADDTCDGSGDGNENTDNDQQVMADDTCDGSGGGNENDDDWDFKRRFQKMQEYMQVTDNILKERLPKILNECKYKIVNMIAGKDFKLLQADICVGTKNIIAKNLMNDSSNQNANTMPVVTEGQKNNTQKTHYYVMLLGCPNLPASDVLHEFLKQYNPMFVKKHKHNAKLLIIKLNKLEDYENLLEADGHCTGDITLAIKPATENVLKMTATPQLVLDEEGNVYSPVKEGSNDDNVVTIE